MPASLILRFARTSRCAIVASGTMKAWAISSVARPAHEGLGDRVLKGVLGEVEVAEGADQDRENPAVLLAEQPVQRGVELRGYAAGTSAGTGITGRTSTDP